MIRRNNLLASFAAAAMWFGVSTTSVGATTLAQSTFDSGNQGWSFFNDGTIPVHQAAGGNPGGFISITDQLGGGAFYFVAPADYTGNKSAAYGGNLHFDLSQSGQGNQVDTDDVVLVGGGLTLAFDAGANPAFFSSWTSYDVSLLAGAGWKVGGLGGAAATEAQLQQVLGSLDAIRIRGEFQGGANGPFADTGRLDNVRLDSGPSSRVPEPSSLALMGLGVLFGSWIMRRRSSTNNS